LMLKRISLRSQAGQAVRYATLACGILLGTLLAVAIGQEDSDVAAPQLFAVLAILYLLGTVISPLLRLAEPKT
jgi:hypothetical protein